MHVFTASFLTSPCHQWSQWLHSLLGGTDDQSDPRFVQQICCELVPILISPGVANSLYVCSWHSKTSIVPIINFDVNELYVFRHGTCQVTHNLCHDGCFRKVLEQWVCLTYIINGLLDVGTVFVYSSVGDGTMSMSDIHHWWLAGCGNRNRL